MISSHSDDPPEIIVKQLRSKTTYRNLRRKLDSKPHMQELGLFLVLGNSSRDAFFYHFFLCSIIEHFSRIPRIILFLDDLKQPIQFEYVAHEIWHLSSITENLKSDLVKYRRNPFFYRIASLLILSDLSNPLKHLVVCDNDILFLDDFSQNTKQNILCQYNEHQGTDLLAKILTQEFGSLTPSYFEERKGPFGDFLFSLTNTHEIRRLLEFVCVEPSPSEIPANTYYYWWLKWLRFINLYGTKRFTPLMPKFSGSKTYCLSNNPVFYHVGGGYEREKLGLFTRELLRHPEIFMHSNIDRQLLEEFLSSQSLPLDIDAWVAGIQPEFENLGKEKYQLHRYNAAIEILSDEFLKDDIQEMISQTVHRLEQIDDLSYRKLMVLENRIIEIKHRTPENISYSAVHLGYPKHTLSKSLEVNWKDFCVNYSMFGESFRDLQFKHLTNDLEMNLTDITENVYQTLIQNLLSVEYSKIAFVDPFMNIGDSYILLRIWRNLCPLTLRKRMKIFTENELLWQTDPFNSVREIEAWISGETERSLIIYPIIFEQHWDQGKQLLLKLGSKIKTFWAPGQNVIVVDGNLYKAESGTTFYNQNLEDYLTHCLAVNNVIPDRVSFRRSRRAKTLINPFGSGSTKHIPYSIIKDLTVNANGPLHILLHHSDHKENQKLVEQIPSSKSFQNREARNLNELSNLISSYDGIISTDSGVAHIANYYRIPVIIFYNSDRTDQSSYISIIYHSVIGYGSKNINFIPIIFSKQSLAGNSIKRDIHTKNFATLAQKYLKWLHRSNWSSMERDGALKFLSIGNRSKNDQSIRRFMRILGLTTEEQNIILASYYDEFPPSQIQKHSKEIPGFSSLIWELSPMRKIALRIINS